jgi:hypothetical protein
LLKVRNHSDVCCVVGSTFRKVAKYLSLSNRVSPACLQECRNLVVGRRHRFVRSPEVRSCMTVASDSPDRHAASLAIRCGCP